MAEWIDMAKKRLDLDDRIENNYYVRHERRAGPLVLSNKKLMFVEEKGFLRKTYNVVFELPYDKIDSIMDEGTNILIITDVEGKQYNFITEYGVLASTIKEKLHEFTPIVGATP